jgi:hypothetical protein
VTAHMSLSQPIEPVTTRRKPAVCRCVGLTGTSRSPLAKVVDNDGRLFSTEFVGVYMQSWGGAPPRYAHPSREFARHKKGRQNRSTSVGNQKFESISPQQKSPLRTELLRLRAAGGANPGNEIVPLLF